MTYRTNDESKTRTYVQAVFGSIPAVFFDACETLRQLDRVTAKIVSLDDPETPERNALDQWADHLYAEAERQIEQFRWQMDDSRDHVIALNALLAAGLDPFGVCDDPALAKGLTHSVERWLDNTPETRFRRDIEYLVNRPHALAAMTRPEEDAAPPGPGL